MKLLSDLKKQLKAVNKAIHKTELYCEHYKNEPNMYIPAHSDFLLLTEEAELLTNLISFYEDDHL